MIKNSISLLSILEKHETPFVLIDSTCSVVGFNKAYEKHISGDKDDCIGQTCCRDYPQCRHQELFNKLEPYDYKDEKNGYHFRGYPLLDKDNRVLLAESVLPLMKKINTAKMVGECQAFIQYRNQLLKAAESSAPVCLYGETGTGKELAAEFIHQHSNRTGNEFVIVDCTVLSEELFESELYGHEKGAFTGAVSGRKGLFETADKGTLFLDEIGELPLSQQPKLLRVLESGQFRRVGSAKTLTTDVRIITATHRNLAEMVKQGKFRQDLFYRLSVFPVEVPPLRQRMKDILILVRFLLDSLGKREGVSYSIDNSALRKLLQHSWPGNIRELKNCLHLAASLSTDHHITVDDILYMQEVPLEDDEDMLDLSDNPLQKMEYDVIKELIEKYQGKRKLIAEELNISERTLYRKLKRLELN